ncbi:MAG TPA: hypothetical protein VJT31_01505 [Rugosimonospora sp.]|nr:hypothetical protein [Rugosimonospora sp.]
MVTTLHELGRTPLDSIPVEQAAELARHVLDRQEHDPGAVEVARFGSVV